MTKEDIKKFMPLMQAMLEGKTIQRHLDDMGWVYTDKIFERERVQLDRVKADAKNRQCNAKEEYWNEMQKHEPFGWLKSKKNGSFCCIGEVSWSDAFRDVHITYSTNESLAHSTISVFNEYTFADGTPFGTRAE